MRRVAGYNLDIFDNQSERPYTADGSVNLAHLLVGAEGTLAYTRSLTLKLRRAAARQGAGRRQLPDLPRRDGRGAAHRQARADRGRAGRPHMIELSLANPAFRPTIETRADRQAGGDPAGRVLRATTSAALLREAEASWSTLMGDLGLPGSVVEMPDDARAEGPVGGAQGRAQHHDEPEGRRQAGELHRGLRRAARAPGRVHRRADRGVRAARHARHLVRARVGRHAARAADPRHAPRRRARRCARSPKKPPSWCASTRAPTAASTATACAAANGSSGSSARRINEAFRAIKRELDPIGLFNPGKIIDPPKMDDASLFRFAPPAAPRPVPHASR